MPEVWRLIELTAPEDAVWNMALDTSLLETPAAGDAPVLRFYRWSRPAFSIGYFQSVEKTVQAFRCAEQNVEVVRRPTGGGLVRHGEDLTLSISMPEDHPRLAGGVSDSYRAVHAVILEALQPLFPGLAFSACAAPLKARSERLCFEEPVSCDIEWRGNKVVGSSQRRKNGRLLHQTSIQLAGDARQMAARISDALASAWAAKLAPSPVGDAEKKSAASVRSSVYGSGEWAFAPSATSSGKSPIFS